MRQIEAIEVHRGARFGAPNDLSVSSAGLDRILVVGSCFAESLVLHVKRVLPDTEADFVLSNHTSLPESPPHSPDRYTCQLVCLPLRSVMNEVGYARLAYDDVKGWQELFVSCSNNIRFLLKICLRWHREHGIPTFVANFVVPQANAMGRLFPRHDLRNPVFFMEELNKVIAAEIAGQTNLYFLDVDQVAASIGRRYIQDDTLVTISHGAFLTDYGYEHDLKRIVTVPPPSEHYHIRIMDFFDGIWLELEAAYRTLKRIDEVKLVIIDLDDTLWRGVAAEDGLSSGMPREGWPVGFQEALTYLKKRGVLLAIASKNDEARVRELWPELCDRLLKLEDFAAVQINWQPKLDNIGKMITAVNLLPSNVVFIDDNPVERAAAQAKYPGIRVLGTTPYYLRRILLWSAETQVATITEESGRRTEMIQAQITRESDRESLSNEDFLKTLDVKSTYEWIADTAHAKFARTFELVNKTNQFNTTGRRWSHDDIQRFFAGGGQIFVFFVTDRYADYGLVGAILVDAKGAEADLRQFVMSCRVFGLNVDHDALQTLLGTLRDRGVRTVRGEMIRTAKNTPCQDIFAKTGFERVGGADAHERWERATA